MKDPTAKLALDTRRGKKLDAIRSKKENLPYPIKIRIRHKGQNQLIGLGAEFSLTENDWSGGKINSKLENAGRLRVRLSEKHKIAKKVIDRNEHLWSSLTCLQLANLVREALEDPEILSKPLTTVEEVEKQIAPAMSFRGWSNTLIDRKKKAKDFGTARWYKDGADALHNFYGGEVLDLKNISKTMLEEFKADHLGKGLKTGGLNTRLRAIRSILNQAVAEDVLEPEYNPFIQTKPNRKKVAIPSAKPEKRAVDAEIISAFKKLYRGEEFSRIGLLDGQEVTLKVQLTVGSADWKAVSETLFMWETWATNFIDLVKLKVEDVIGWDIIEYSRSKNDSPVKVVLSELAREIAAYHAAGKDPDGFLFRFGWEETETGYQRYVKQRQRFNETITRIARAMGYDISMTSYVIRHTFATTLNKNGVTRDFIGEMYGHQDDRSISTYIDKKDVHSLAEKANAALVNI